MTEILRAPWSDDQVRALNEFQRVGMFHPFTCGPCRDNLGTWQGNDFVDRRLVATKDGWRCPTCDYEQDWCWPMMADGSMVEAFRQDPIGTIRTHYLEEEDAADASPSG